MGPCCDLDLDLVTLNLKLECNLDILKMVIHEKESSQVQALKWPALKHTQLSYMVKLQGQMSPAFNRLWNSPWLCQSSEFNIYYFLLEKIVSTCYDYRVEPRYNSSVWWSVLLRFTVKNKSDYYNYSSGTIIVYSYPSNGLTMEPWSLGNWEHGKCHRFVWVDYLNNKLTRL